MAAVQRNLYIEQGATFTFSFTWSDGVEVGGEVTAGAPKDLTGYTARMQIRESQGAAPQITADTTNGKIVLGVPLGGGAADPTNGRVTVKLTDEDTDSFTIKKGKYDLEVENSAGDVFRLLEGAVTVSPNITQEDGTEPVIP